MLPEPRKGQIASAPCRAVACVIAVAMRPSASSHEIRSNCPRPLGPTRPSGCMRRSGERA
jgi:hypothetical protein